jgi:hypothetical protein
MGIWANSQEEAHRKMQELVEDAMPDGDTLAGAVHAHQQSTFSVKFYVIGATDHHLIVIPVDKKWRATDAAPIVLRPDEIDVENLFDEGRSRLSQLGLSEKGQELRFAARGEKYKFKVLGGTMIEDALASGGQIDGLTAVIEFLRGAASWTAAD